MSPPFPPNPPPMGREVTRNLVMGRPKAVASSRRQR